MNSSGSGSSKSQKRGGGEKRKGPQGGGVDKISDEEYEGSDSENPIHYASMELKKILHFNEGIDKMNELAAHLHREFMDDTNKRSGAASSFYDQLVSIENAHKYPTYLSHTPDSMFETKHIKFESPALNPGSTGLVCRDPSPEDYAKFLENSEIGEFDSGPGPSSSYIDRNAGNLSNSSTKIKRGISHAEKNSPSRNNSEDEIHSAIHAPEIWKLVPDNSYVARQNLKDSMVSDIGEKQSTRRIVNNYYPTKNAFTDSTKAQAFWVHLGIPMPSPPTPFLTSTFLKLNNLNPQPSGLVTLDSGVRRFCVGMHGFSSEELTFAIEGKKIIVTGTKLEDESKKRKETERFTLPDDLQLHDLQVHRDNVGNVIFEEIWHEPVEAEERLTVLNEEIPDFFLKD